MPGKNPHEVVKSFASSICETLGCITSDPLQPYQETAKLYKLMFARPARVAATNGDPFYVSVTQTLTVNADEDGSSNVHTREYSYVFSESAAFTSKGVLAYHWHPEDFSLRDPHLHITITQNLGYPEIERRIARAHFPTSQVCLEDFVLLLVRYYDQAVGAFLDLEANFTEEQG